MNFQDMADDLQTIPGPGFPGHPQFNRTFRFDLEWP